MLLGATTCKLLVLTLLLLLPLQLYDPYADKATFTPAPLFPLPPRLSYLFLYPWTIPNKTLVPVTSSPHTLPLHALLTLTTPSGILTYFPAVPLTFYRNLNTFDLGMATLRLSYWARPFTILQLLGSLNIPVILLMMARIPTNLAEPPQAEPRE